MRSRLLLEPVVACLGLALGAWPISALAQANPGDGGWNQGRVAAIAEAFAEEVDKLHLEAKKVPPDITFSQQRAQYELKEDIRLLKIQSAYLAKQLMAGKGREETRPTYNRMQQIRSSAEENARRTMIPEQLMDQILAAGSKLLELQPYYRLPEEAPPES